MFRKLYQDNSVTLQKQQQKNNSYKKSLMHKNEQKNSSYVQKYRKKNSLLPQIPDLQIIQTESFLFQGRLASIMDAAINKHPEREKHGQGVMFLKNGTLIVGNWDHGLLYGRVLIFTPFGGKTTAHFYNGKIYGWTITTFAQKLVICTKYYENKIDGEKIIFQANEQMWVVSKFIKQSASFKIIHIQKGVMLQLPDYINMITSSQGQSLPDLYDSFIRNKQLCIQIKEIKSVSISNSLSYVGYCNEYGSPNGLGAIFGRNQYYLGHFRDGSLQCYGRMIFQNGQVYHGDLLNGIFYGQGVYYNPQKNISSIIQTSRQEQKVIDQHEGYICINQSMNYFKYSSHNSTGLIGDPLYNFQEILEKYYATYFIDNKYQQENASSADSQLGISQNLQDQYQSVQRKSAKNINEQNLILDNQKRWINFKESDSSRNDQRSFNNSRNDDENQLQKVYSLDKRQAQNMQAQSTDQSYNFNLKNWTQQDLSNLGKLTEQIKKSQIQKKPNLQQKPQLMKIQSIKVKQNIDPFENDKYNKNLNQNTVSNINSISRKNTIGVNQQNGKNSSLDLAMLTFRSTQQDQQLRIIESIKNQRKYSHMIELENDSPHSSIVSNLSQRVEGMMKKTQAKRKKIFM